jgi:hypothetical protein
VGSTSCLARSKTQIRCCVSLGLVALLMRRALHASPGNRRVRPKAPTRGLHNADSERRTTARKRDRRCSCCPGTAFVNPARGYADVGRNTSGANFRPGSMMSIPKRGFRRLGAVAEATGGRFLLPPKSPSGEFSGRNKRAAGYRITFGSPASWPSQCPVGGVLDPRAGPSATVGGAGLLASLGQSYLAEARSSKVPLSFQGSGLYECDDPPDMQLNLLFVGRESSGLDGVDGDPSHLRPTSLRRPDKCLVDRCHTSRPECVGKRSLLLRRECWQPIVIVQKQHSGPPTISRSAAARKRRTLQRMCG